MSTSTEKLLRGYAYLITFVNDKSIRDMVRRELNEPEHADEGQRSPDDTKEALQGVHELFAHLKINPFFKAGEELTFTFTRRCPDDRSPCGDNDAKWKNDLKPLAA